MAKHVWSFSRIGGFDQVDLRDGEDLAHLRELDQKLWVALACPVKGIEFDERTLELIDIDKDGRIRANELITAVEWMDARLVDLDAVMKGKSSVPLAKIDSDTDEGKRIRASVDTILRSIGKTEAKSVSLDDVLAAVEHFNKQGANGDGIVTVDTASDDDERKLIEDAVACSTAVVDRSGAQGISEAIAASFMEEIMAHAAWITEGEALSKVAPFEGVSEAYVAVSEVREKVDDWFARARIAAFDPRALGAVNRAESEYTSIVVTNLDASAKELESFPLAQVAPGRALPLSAGVNPAWQSRITVLRSKAVVPALGERQSLAEADWHALLDKLSAHHAWVTRKKGTTVEKLGAARVLAIARSNAKERFDKLFSYENAAAPKAEALEEIERLVRYARDLLSLARNFVSFHDFYLRKKKATFQVGTLYLDQRACDLCVNVADAARHTTMAPRSNLLLVYCDIKNAQGETGAIAAAMTGGDVDNLIVGRNGIFYDRDGQDWDATITKIVDNPISLSQAFWSPYRKLARTIEEQIAKRTARAEADAEAKSGDLAAATGNVVEGQAPVIPPLPMKFDAGTVAALGVAVGGITAAIGTILGTIFGLGLWMPLGVLALILAISAPATVAAWLKLRRRNLGPLLDANGWAVNAMARINVPLGESLTQVASVPRGSKRTLVDPYEEPRRSYWLYGVVFAVLVGAFLWYLGKLDFMLPTVVRSTTVLGVYAPARVVPAEGAVR